jgi:hypothetical protein
MSYCGNAHVIFVGELMSYLEQGKYDMSPPTNMT